MNEVIKINSKAKEKITNEFTEAANTLKLNKYQLNTFNMLYTEIIKIFEEIQESRESEEGNEEKV